MLILRRLAFMAFVFEVTWGLALFARIEDALGGKDKSNLQMIGLTLSGFCNFVVWGATNQKVINWVWVKVFGLDEAEGLTNGTGSIEESLTQTLTRQDSRMTTKTLPDLPDLPEEREPSFIGKDRSFNIQAHGNL